jgi:predicted DNA-binding transcriptional regulator AlpA
MENNSVSAIWIRGPQLRKRWGGMPVSTFYDRLKKGAIPQPKFPFGPHTPYWHMDSIQAHERAAKAKA